MKLYICYVFLSQQKIPSGEVQGCHKDRRRDKDSNATTGDQRDRGRQRSNDQLSKSGSSSRLADTSPTVKTPPRHTRHKPTYSSSSESVDHIDNWRKKSDEQKAVEREMKRQIQKKVQAEPQKSRKNGRCKEKRDDKREETKDGRSQTQRARGSKASRHVAGQSSDDQKERKKQKRRNKRRQGLPGNGKSGIDGEIPPHADQYEKDLYFSSGPDGLRSEESFHWPNDSHLIPPSMDEGDADLGFHSTSPGWPEVPGGQDLAAVLQSCHQLGFYLTNQGDQHIEENDRVPLIDHFDRDTLASLYHYHSLAWLQATNNYSQQCF